MQYIFGIMALKKKKTKKKPIVKKKTVKQSKDTTDKRILDEIKKEVKVDEIVYAMETLSKTTITPKISFMVGLPGENDEEVQETYSLCIKLKKMFLKTKNTKIKQQKAIWKGFFFLGG